MRLMLRPRLDEQNGQGCSGLQRGGGAWLAAMVPAPMKAPMASTPGRVQSVAIVTPGSGAWARSPHQELARTSRVLDD